MPNVVDTRVVEMQFDNAQFEAGIHETMRSLDRFDKSISHMEDTQLGGLGSVLTDCTAGFSQMAQSAEMTIGQIARFSILGTSISKITGEIMTATENFIKAVTIDPIKTGYEEYNTYIDAFQSIMAGTRSKFGLDVGGLSDEIKEAKTAEQVAAITAALDELNSYADKTIYNFTQMTNSVGKFTQAGIDLDQAIPAIEGISNLAAMSGADSAANNRAMYNISQALSAGTMRAQDWMSIENANMGTKEFQELLLKIGKRVGAAKIDTSQGFRNSLSSGWLTKDVLMEALSYYGGAYQDWERIKATGGWDDAYAKYLYELGEAAKAAATQVKTVPQLLDTLKEAAQSGWTRSWQIILGDLTEAKETLTAISKFVGEILDTNAEKRNKMLQNWKDLGGRKYLFSGIGNIAKAVKGAFDAISKGWHNVFDTLTGSDLARASDNFEYFSKSIRDAFTYGKNARVLTLATETVAKYVNRIAFSIREVLRLVSGVKQALNPLWGMFYDVGVEILKISNIILGLPNEYSTTINKILLYVPKWTAPLSEFRQKVEYIFAKIRTATTVFVMQLKNLTPIQDAIKTFLDITGITGYARAAGQYLTDTFRLLKNIITEAFKDLVSGKTIWNWLLKDLTPSERLGEFVLKEHEGFWKRVFKILGSRILDAVNSFRKYVSTAISTALSKIWLNLIDDLTPDERHTEAVLKVNEGAFLRILKILASRLRAAVTEFAKTIGNSFMNLWSRIAPMITEAVQGIKTGETIWSALIKNLSAEDAEAETLLKLQEGTWTRIFKLLGSMIKTNGARLLSEAVRFAVKAASAAAAKVSSWIPEGFKNGVVNGMLRIKDAVVNAFTAVITWVKDLFDIHSPSKVFEAIGRFIVEGFKNGIEWISSVWPAIKDFFSPIITWIKDRTSDLVTSIVDFFRNGGIEKALDSLGDILGKGWDWMKNSLADFVHGGAEFLASRDFQTYFEFAKQLVNIFAELRVANGIAAGGSGLMTFGKSISEGVKSITKAVNDIKNGAGTLETIKSIFSGKTGIIDGLKALFSGNKTKALDKSSDSFSTSLLKISASLMLLAGAVYIFSKFSWDDVSKAVGMMVSIILTVGISARIAKTIDGGGFLKLAFALLAMVGAIELLRLVSWEVLTDSLKKLAAMLLTIRLTMGNSSAFNGSFWGLIGLASAITIITFALAKLAKIKMEGIARGVAGIIGIIAALRFAAGGKFAFKGKGLITMALTLYGMSLVLEKLAKMDFRTFSRSIVYMTVMMAELKLATLATRGMYTKGLFSLTILMGAMTGIVYVMGNMDTATLYKGMFAAGILVLMLRLLIKGINGVSFGGSILSNIGMFIGISIVMATIASIVVILGSMDPSVLKKGVAVAGALGLFVWALVKVGNMAMKGIKGKELLKLGVMMGILAGVLFAIGTALKNLAPTLAAAAGMTAFAAAVKDVMTGFSLFYLALSIGGRFGDPKAIAKFMGMVAVVGAIATFVGALANLILGDDEESIGKLLRAMNTGGKILGELGTMFGRFIGGILGGIEAGVTAVLPGIAQDLGDFAEGMGKFSENSKNINGDTLAKVAEISDLLLLLAAEDFVETPITFAGLIDPYEDFKENSKTVMEALTDFTTRAILFSVVYGNGSRFDTAITATKRISDMLTAVPSEDLFTRISWAKSNVQMLEENIPHLFTALSTFATAVNESDYSDYDTDKAVSVTRVGTDLATVLKAIPEYTEWEKIGVLQTNAEELATDIDALMTALGTFAEKANELDKKLKTAPDGLSYDISKVETLVGDFVTLIKGFDKLGYDWWNTINITDTNTEAFSNDVETLVTGLITFAGKFEELKTAMKNVETKRDGTWDVSKFTDIVATFAGMVEGVQTLNYEVWEKISGLGVFTDVDMFSMDVTKLTRGVTTFAKEYPSLVSAMNSAAETMTDPETGKKSWDISALDTLTTDLMAILEKAPGYDVYTRIGLVKSDVEVMSGDLKALGDGVHSFADSMKEAFGLADGALLKTQTAAVQWVIDSLITFADKIMPKDGSNGLFNDIDHYFGGDNSKWGRFQTMATGLDTASGHLSVFAAHLKDFSSDMSTAFTNATAQQMMTYNNDAFNVINNLAGFADEFEGPGTAGLWDTIENFFMGDKTAWGKLKRISNEISGFGSGFATFSTGIAMAKDATENLQLVETFITEVADWLNGDNLSDGWDDIMLYTDDFATIFGSIGAMVANMNETILGMGDVDAESGLEYINSTSGILTAFVDLLKLIKGADSMQAGLNTQLGIDMNGGLELQPVITPVVDMTNVESAYSRINSMMGGNVTLGRRTTALAMQGPVLKVDNSDVVNELRVIESRIDSLSESVGSMQMVLDTGTLVGSITNQIDRRLAINAGRILRRV